jgi:transcriptional regulator with XRE-family HTH domain
MDEFRLVIASNLIKLRTGAGLTQLELGERLSYSDKTISKWERGDSMPDVYVLSQIAEMFGVTLDYLVSEHDEWESEDDRKKREDQVHFSGTAVTLVSLAGIWTLAMLAFVVFWLMGSMQWIIFVIAVPASLITLLVLNTVWRGGRHNVYIVAGLVFSVVALIYITVLKLSVINPWQLFLVLIPAEIVVFLSFRIKKKQ